MLHFKLQAYGGSLWFGCPPSLANSGASWERAQPKETERAASFFPRRIHSSVFIRAWVTRESLTRLSSLESLLKSEYIQQRTAAIYSLIMSFYFCGICLKWKLQPQPLQPTCVIPTRTLIALLQLIWRGGPRSGFSSISNIKFENLPFPIIDWLLIAFFFLGGGGFVSLLYTLSCKRINPRHRNIFAP